MFSLFQNNSSGTHKPTMKLEAACVKKKVSFHVKILVSPVKRSMNIFPFNFFLKSCEKSFVFA